MFRQIICFCIMVNVSHVALTKDIKSCPLNNVEWREAAKQLNCVPEVNGTYHCILAFYGSTKVLNETCMTPSLINSDEVGCPNVRFIEEIPVFYRPFVRCRDDSGRCPGKNHRLYYTDQLYEFPECIELEDKKSIPDTTAGVLTTDGINKIPTPTVQSATTKTSKCISSELNCELCSTRFAVAEPHSKPIEIVSLLLLLIAATMLAILLFCPTKFLTRLRWIRGEDSTHHAEVPTEVTAHSQQAVTERIEFFRMESVPGN